MNHQAKIERWEKARSTLAAHFRDCLNHRTPAEVNLSIPRHSITAPVLRGMAFDKGFHGKSLPVVFADASKPQPFPLGCFTADSPPPSGGPIVKLGLASFRHPDMDYVVDLFLIRNRDLNAELSMAAEEQMIYERSVELLSDSVFRDGGQIWVFHTGLEPMVVGFYRGVVTVLQERRRLRLPRQLVVTPFLYALDHSTTKGITPESPGAKLESYVRADPWW